jgi:hypothetical protein
MRLHDTFLRECHTRHHSCTAEFKAVSRGSASKQPVTNDTLPDYCTGRRKQQLLYGVPETPSLQASQLQSPSARPAVLAASMQLWMLHASRKAIQVDVKQFLRTQSE